MESTSNFCGEVYFIFKKGKNLEELFLKAREIGDVADYPMISTPEGEFVDEKLYAMLSRYLDYNDNSVFNLHKSYEKENEEKFNQQICSVNSQFDELNSLLDLFKTMVKVGDSALDSEFDSLKKALFDYRSYQKEYENSLRQTFDLNRELTEV
jgi:hypothetical protein